MPQVEQYANLAQLEVNVLVQELVRQLNVHVVHMHLEQEVQIAQIAQGTHTLLVQEVQVVRQFHAEVSLNLALAQRDAVEVVKAIHAMKVEP